MSEKDESSPFRGATIQHIHGNIFLGPGNGVEQLVHHAFESRDALGTEMSIGILDVADDYPEWSHHRDVLFVHAGLNDGPEDWEAPWGGHNSPTAYLNAIQALDFLADKQSAVYVHCHSGVSRSCFVVCLYFWWVYREKFEDIIEAVNRRYGRVHIHPKHLDRLPHLQELLRVMPGSRCPLYWRDKIGSLVE